MILLDLTIKKLGAKNVDSKAISIMNVHPGCLAEILIFTALIVAVKTILLMIAKKKVKYFPTKLPL